MAISSTAHICETIVAPATPPGRGGVGIIRISGSGTTNIAEKILGFIPKPRYAHFGKFLNSKKEIIDEGIALYFPNPNSYTGEDVLELQAHGGPIVLDNLIKVILKSGARLAKPGEFSERAFLNGKMDLAQAEAIADLINATSQAAANSALKSMQGVFSEKINSLVDDVTKIRMHIESAIDFPEEEIDFLSDGVIENKLKKINKKLYDIKKSATQGALLQEGMTLVLVGAPNAGKSSLLNQLSGKDSAIVTDIAGTTRDVLREQINIDGLPLHIVDTAGLRETDNIIEKEGIKRTKAEIKKADLVLLITADSVLPTKRSDEGISLVNDFIPKEIPILVIKNKIDLTKEKPGLSKQQEHDVISLSAKNGDGIDQLKNYLEKKVGFEKNAQGVFMARRRHLDALNRAEQLLQKGLEQLQQDKAGELLAEDCRLAQLALCEITGEFSADDLLGKIFSEFCIGK